MFGLFQLINTLQPFSSQIPPTSKDLASMGVHSLTAVVKSLTTMQTHTYIPCSGSLWHTPILSIHFPEDKTMKKKNQDWSSHFKKQKTRSRWYNFLLYSVQFQHFEDSDTFSTSWVIFNFNLSINTRADVPAICAVYLLSVN